MSASAAIIGANGFLGRSLAAALARKGWRVRALSRSWRRGDSELLGPGIELVTGDVVSVDATRAVVEGCDVAYYLAYDGVPLVDGSGHLDDYQRNLSMQIAAMRACESAGVTTFVFGSSGGTIYGDQGCGPSAEDSELRPESHYGVIKRLGEQLLADYSRLTETMSTFAVRLSNPFGPGQIRASRKGLIVSTMLSAINDEPVAVHGDGSQVRDYMFVNDAVDAMVQMTTCEGAPGVAVNVGSGVGRSVREVLDDIADVTGLPLTLKPVPVRTQDVEVSVLNTGKLLQLVDRSSFVGYEEGLRRTWDAVRSAHCTLAEEAGRV